jgi:hypothetical protein
VRTAARVAVGLIAVSCCIAADASPTPPGPSRAVGPPVRATGSGPVSCPDGQVNGGIVDYGIGPDTVAVRTRPEEQSVWIEPGLLKRFPHVHRVVAVDRHRRVTVVYEEPDGTWRAELDYYWDDRLGWYLSTLAHC